MIKSLFLIIIFWIIAKTFFTRLFFLYVVSSFLCFCSIYIRLQPFRHFFNCKKVFTKKVESWKPLYSVLKDEKLQYSYTFMQIAVFVGPYLLLFQQIRNHHQILCFFISKSNFLGGRIRTFADFEAKRARNGSKTRKIFFPSMIHNKLYFPILVSD
jgi:hypothetical protein